MKINPSLRPRSELDTFSKLFVQISINKIPPGNGFVTVSRKKGLLNFTLTRVRFYDISLREVTV